MNEGFERIIEEGIAMIMQRKTGENLEGGEELKVINWIKDNLINTLRAFWPDLPAQYSSQLESRAQKMETNNGMLFETSELSSFLIAYKIELDTIITMVSDNEKIESWDERKEKKEKKDDMQNIRTKMRKYQDFFEKLFNIEKEKWLENLNLRSFNEWTESMKNSAEERVEWQKQWD